MADRDELRALAQRVMALAGPDREVDALVWAAMGGGVSLLPVLTGSNVLPMSPDCPRFTGSLDSAMTLGRQFLLVAMSDIAADGLPGVCLCSDTSTSPPKEHWGTALGGASGPREQVLARCYTAAALLALAEQVPE